MSTVFFISDTHFGHKKIIDFEWASRPFDSIEEHDEQLVQNWNEVVTKRDVVYHLGDVLFGKHSFVQLSRLNGTKKLVMGNHDRYPIADYAEHFTKIFGSMKFDDAVLTHIPVHTNQFHRFARNLHGHMHSKTIDDPRYINCCCEQIALTPIPYEVLRERFA